MVPQWKADGKRLESSRVTIMITLEEAKHLTTGDIIYGAAGKKFKVNGNVKIWKRSPERVQVPLKHGLYTYGYLTEDNLHLFSLTKIRYRLLASVHTASYQLMAGQVGRQRQ